MWEDDQNVSGAKCEVNNFFMNLRLQSCVVLNAGFLVNLIDPKYSKNLHFEIELELEEMFVVLRSCVGINGNHLFIVKELIQILNIFTSSTTFQVSLCKSCHNLPVSLWKQVFS